MRLVGGWRVDLDDDFPGRGPLCQLVGLTCPVEAEDPGDRNPQQALIDKVSEVREVLRPGSRGDKPEPGSRPVVPLDRSAGPAPADGVGDPGGGGQKAPKRVAARAVLSDLEHQLGDQRSAALRELLAPFAGPNESDPAFGTP